MKDMNDLQIENYDAKEVETKKQSLLKRSTAAGSAIVLSLSLFNLAGCVPITPPIIAGGAGAWFQSCPEDECECIKCECTDADCPPIIVGGSGAWYHSHTVNEDENMNKDESANDDSTEDK